MMPMKSPLIDNHAVWLLLSFYATLPLAIIAHKAGLALMARWLGFDVTSFGFGTARPVLVMRCGRTLLYVCARGLPHCQVSVLFPDSVRKTQLTAYLAGGLLGCLVLVAIGAAGCYLYPRWAVFGGTLAVVNVACILGAAEWRYAWRLWRGIDIPSPPLPGLSLLHRNRVLWQAIGDKRAEADALQSASEDWRMLGDADYANALLREGDALQAGTGTEGAGRPHLRRGIFAWVGEPYETVAAEFTAAMQAFQNTGNVGEQIHTGLHHACWAAENGRFEEAEKLLHDWSTHPRLATDPVLQAIAWRAQLVVRSQSMSAEQVGAIQTQYVVLSQRAQLPAEVDWAMYRRLTAVYAQRQDTKRAQASFRLAAEAARRILAELPTEEDRNRFVRCGQQFDQQVAALFEDDFTVSWSDCVAELNAELKQEIQTGAEAQSKQQREERCRLRIGWILLPLNILVFALLLMNVPLLWETMTERHVSNWVFFSVIMTIFLFVASIVGSLVYHVLYFIAGFLPTRTDERPGSMSISLGMLPWLVAPVPILGMIVHIWFD
jgi:hypothetical protein